MQSLIKRLLASAILILILPIILVLSIIIKLDSSGSAVFKQRRLGKNKKIFSILKFRTMRVGSEKLQRKYQTLNEADGPVFKITNDPRYTKFGKHLSRTGIDELLQLINIIKGEMDFVGPRPLPINEARKIPNKYAQRFSQLPGITSSWVVKGAHSLPFNRWMELDLEDIRKKSVKYDLNIGYETIRMVMKILFANSI